MLVSMGNAKRFSLCAQQKNAEKQRSNNENPRRCVAAETANIPAVVRGEHPKVAHG